MVKEALNLVDLDRNGSSACFEGPGAGRFKAAQPARPSGLRGGGPALRQSVLAGEERQHSNIAWRVVVGCRAGFCLSSHGTCRFYSCTATGTRRASPWKSCRRMAEVQQLEPKQPSVCAQSCQIMRRRCQTLVGHFLMEGLCLQFSQMSLSKLRLLAAARGMSGIWLQG